MDFRESDKSGEGLRRLDLRIVDFSPADQSLADQPEFQRSELIVQPEIAAKSAAEISLVQRLMVAKLYRAAQLIEPAERKKVERYISSGDRYAEEPEMSEVFEAARFGILKDMNLHGQRIEGYLQLIESLGESSYETLEWFSESLGFEIPVAQDDYFDIEKLADEDPELLTYHGRDVRDLRLLVERFIENDLLAIRAEIFRRVLFVRSHKQHQQFVELLDEIRDKLGIVGLEAIIDRLEKSLPVSVQQKERYSTFDLPVSNIAEHTRLHRALSAIKNLLEMDLKDADSLAVADLITQTAKFVLAILNPDDGIVRFSNISDVYGSEANVPNPENDATRLRVKEHREELRQRYGIKLLDVAEQGTSINCPEQCGFDAMIAVAQAARADRNIRIEPRFFVLNNASRTKSADGIEGGVELSQSSSLLYFTFKIGGVLHKGVAYGYQTLSLLKDFIVDLYEIEGTDRGTQFRSLEIEQHIAALAALADGNLPTCYKYKKIPLEAIPKPALTEGEYLFMGCDKFGNGILSVPASELLKKYLFEGESSAEILVTIRDRQNGKIVGPKKYVIAKSLGSIRDRSPAVWESSTPDPKELDRGFANIGVFKENSDDINGDIVNIPAGSIIRIEPVKRTLRDLPMAA